MSGTYFRRLAVALCVAAFGAAVLPAQQLKEEPIPHARGQSVTPAFEGWYRNADGTFALVFGYFNRNYQQELDIPVGPNNRIEPGPADQGQPTHFNNRRHTGTFAVVVPKDFGVDKKVTWTLVSGGETISVPGHIKPDFEIDALKESTSGNTPPAVKLSATGKVGQGQLGVRASATATVGTPLPLEAFIADDGVVKAGGGESKPVFGAVWSLYRGQGPVKFENAEPKIVNGKASTKVTFSQPGDYTLRMLAWDASGKQAFVMAGGFYCCWTNAYVDVVVK